MQIKICGLTNLAEALAAAELGANFLGFNFFPSSKRYLDPAVAQVIGREVQQKFPQLKLVGIFVNAAVKEVRQILEICHLDVLQFHGQETLEFCQKFLGAKQQVWRALRINSQNFVVVDCAQQLQQFRQLDGILLDTFSIQEFGGTGQTFAWEKLQPLVARLPNLILSGGLTSQNVQQACQILQPQIVDVCSGVEAAQDPRRKDLTKMREFCLAIRQLNLEK